MKLADYLRSRKKSLAEASRETGYSRVAFYHWLNGKRFPRAATLRKLEHWSKGAIRANDFTLGRGR